MTKDSDTSTDPNPVKRLLLHGGGPKTGSSFLQVLLARHAEGLLSQRIRVPEGAQSANAKNGKITSGNGLELANFLNPSLKHIGPDRNHVLQSVEAEMDRGDHDTLVYSSEFLVPSPNAPTNLLLELCAARGYHVEFVFLVRDYSDAAYSFYSQSVKRHTDVRPFSEFLETYEPVYHQRLASAAQVLPDDQIIVFNYGSNAARLGSLLFKDILGADIEVDEDLSVNRSLTFEEVEVMRHMNQFFPKGKNFFASYVSDSIVYNTAPKSDYRFSFLPQEAEDLRTRFSEPVETVNHWLPDDPIKVISTKMSFGERTPTEFSATEEILLALIIRLVKQQVTASRKDGLKKG